NGPGHPPPPPGWGPVWLQPTAATAPSVAERTLAKIRRYEGCRKRARQRKCRVIVERLSRGLRRPQEHRKREDPRRAPPYRALVGPEPAPYLREPCRRVLASAPAQHQPLHPTPRLDARRASP